MLGSGICFIFLKALPGRSRTDESPSSLFSLLSELTITLQYGILVMEVIIMTITLTAKNQITIPSKIAKTLGLKKGALFTIGVHKNKIELIPVEIREKTFSPEVYDKLEALTAKEKGKEKKVTKSFIKNLKSGE